jgi:hypothetical protein
VKFPTAGTYRIRLAANDSQLIGQDEVTVTVSRWRALSLTAERNGVALPLIAEVSGIEKPITLNSTGAFYIEPLPNNAVVIHFETHLQANN